MLKRPITIISNDQHIKDDNVEEKKKLFRQQCELAKSLNIDNISLLGDLFDSRKHQSLRVLNGISDIFNMIEDYGLICHIIPGNHDKTNYQSDESFLDSFRFHPNVKLYRDVTIVSIDGLNLYFVPFWEDSILVDKLSNIEDNSIILSHFGTNGSINNDGTKHNTVITIESLKRFKKVLLGHFHDQMQVGSNIYHLPSIQQNNFGENSDKGFTVLYSDGSHELVKSKFKEYVKVKIDVDKVSKKELNDLVTEYSNQTKDSYVRFILEGTEDKIKSINKDVLQSSGIDIKTVNKEIENVTVDFDEIEIKKYIKEDLLDEFQMFCEEYDKDYEKGLEYIKTI